jgi:hypothetical protein
MLTYEQEQLEIIKNFIPVHATHYYTEQGVKSYFGVILREGSIDVKKYPSGRVHTIDLEENEHFITFKKIVTKDKEAILYLREYLNEEELNEVDLKLYKYIKDNCRFESY